MLGRVEDDVVDFPGLPRMLRSSRILELDQTSVACPDRTSAPFPNDAAGFHTKSRGSPNNKFGAMFMGHP